jgi:hypothetical protein
MIVNNSTNINNNNKKESLSVHSNAILNIKMYSCISLGLKITKIKIPGNIVERLWHTNNVTSIQLSPK